MNPSKCTQSWNALNANIKEGYTRTDILRWSEKAEHRTVEGLCETREIWLLLGSGLNRIIHKLPQGRAGPASGPRSAHPAHTFRSALDFTGQGSSVTSVDVKIVLFKFGMTGLKKMSLILPPLFT